jgi:hypothetical protein
MYKATRLVHVGDADDATTAQLIRELREAAGIARRALVERTLPGVRNGGDILAHLQFDTRESWRAAEPQIDAVLSAEPIRHVDGVEYYAREVGVAEPGATGSVYRTLLLRVAPHTPTEVTARFEADLLRMPDYIAAIRSWQLSTVDRAIGTSPWTHVWEQEFSDIDGLTGPYLMHPIHWAHVDRWFDPECPEFIVRDRVCHSYCSCDGPVLAADVKVTT